MNKQAYAKYASKGDGKIFNASMTGVKAGK